MKKAMAAHSILRSGLLGSGLIFCVAFCVQASPPLRDEIRNEPSATMEPTGTQTLDDRTDFDPLGTRLPAGLDRETIISALAPDLDRRLITLVGAKPWLRHPQQFLAILCMSPSPSAGNQAPRCDREPLFHLGLFELDNNRKPVLLADSGLLATSDLHDAVIPDWEATDDYSRARPQVWDGFDPAPYPLSPDHDVFGLRGHVRFGTYISNGLYLFERNDGKLRPIFAAQIDSRQEDSTHPIPPTSKVLTILPTRTSGYCDLLLRDHYSGREIRFAWLPQVEHYESVW